MRGTLVSNLVFLLGKCLFRPATKRSKDNRNRLIGDSEIRVIRNLKNSYGYYLQEESGSDGEVQKRPGIHKIE